MIFDMICGRMNYHYPCLLVDGDAIVDSIFPKILPRVRDHDSSKIKL